MNSGVECGKIEVFPSVILPLNLYALMEKIVKAKKQRNKTTSRL
jgi:hypothetical protein